MNLQEKPCTECGEAKPRYASDRSICKDCRRGRSAKHRAENPHYMKHWNRERRILDHGISTEQYDSLVWLHNDRCAICGSDDPKAGRWHIDHDHACCPGTHSCGVCIRGLLCSPCNLGIGYLQESEFILESAVAYLQKVRPLIGAVPSTCKS